ncbi:MAG: class I SAM-dependent methyltransferase [Lentisphaerales bacterium]|nr:MAG: class I SAM-dependent methyltransferase [Lentisphaerales bacterium]
MPISLCPDDLPAAESIRHETRSIQVQRDLELLSNSANYQQWIYGLIRPYLGSRILEIGSGIGNYTQYLLEHGEVWGTDCEDYYLARLKERFGSSLARIERLELGTWDPEQRSAVVAFQPDTIVCLNVLEHVEEDLEAVRMMTECLSPDGRLVLIVPAFNSLFATIDRNYGHCHRYNKARVRTICERTGSVLSNCRYFNMLGIFAWIWNYKLLRRGHLVAGQVHAFDRIVPMLARIERFAPPPAGLSLLVTITRRQADD